jgi:hypothetical protein
VGIWTGFNWLMLEFNDEHGNRAPSFVKGGGILDKIREYQFLK